MALLPDYKNFFKNNTLICCLLIGLLSRYAYASVSGEARCRACPSLELARRNTSYQNSNLSDSFFTRLQQESHQKVEALQKDPAFQEIVSELQNNAYHIHNATVNSISEDQGNLNEVNLPGESLSKTSLYIFISFSMGEKALLNLAHEAKRFGATLVLRGFLEGSYVKTAQALQKIILKTGQGVIIDPELYTLFNLTAVPTFVLAKPFNLMAAERIQTPIHDKLQGHVSVRYALEYFAKEGDLKQTAQQLLTEGATP